MQEDSGVDRVDCLAIGHLCLDEDESVENLRLGGAVVYAGVAARNLGYRVGIVTAARPDFALYSLGDKVNVFVRKSQATTRFRYSYSPGGQRKQLLLSRADGIGAADVPIAWRNTPIVFLSPIVQEFDGSLVETFSSSSFIGLIPQGWLRKWNAEGVVSPTRWPGAERYLRAAQAAVFSLDDVGGDWRLARQYAQFAPLAVVTIADEGAVLFQRGEGRRFKTRPAQVVDATGAGDVFAAAFFLRLYEGGDPVAACRFANVMASFSTEGVGWTAVPSRSDVEKWMSEHPNGEL